MKYIEAYKGAGVTLALTDENSMRKYFRSKLIAYPQKRAGLERAIEFAIKAHEGQVRKGTNIPYIVHPLEAAYIVDKLTDDMDVVAAAVLHDVVEDAGVTVKELKELFGERVARFVEAVSEDRSEDEDSKLTWKERKLKAISEVSRGPKEVKLVAMGDKLANMRAIYRDYVELGDQVFERFNEKNKEEHKWHYTSLATAMNVLNDTPAWKELTALINYVFSSRQNKK